MASSTHSSSNPMVSNTSSNIPMANNSSSSSSSNTMVSNSNNSSNDSSNNSSKTMVRNSLIMLSSNPRMDLTVSSRYITRILGTWIQEVISMPKVTRQRLNPDEVRQLILLLLGEAILVPLSIPQVPGLLRLALEMARSL
jgi:hypothetical protein